MKVSLIIPFLFLFGSAVAQESNSIHFRLGLGTYLMKSQKLLQQDIKNNSPIPFEAVTSFPAFPTFGVSLGFKLTEEASLGCWVEYASTGARLSYGDYSGNARIDQLLNTFQIGPFAQYRITKSTTWPLYVTMHTSLASTTQRLTSEIEVAGNRDREDYLLKSINYGIRPGVMLSRDFSPVTFQLGLGAEIQFHGEMKSKKNDGAIFQTSDGKHLISQWDGLRATFGVGFKL